MVVQVRNSDRTITKSEVVPESLSWFAANVLQGTLTDGSTFRAWVDPTTWANWWNA